MLFSVTAVRSSKERENDKKGGGCLWNAMMMRLDATNMNTLKAESKKI